MAEDREREAAKGGTIDIGCRLPQGIRLSVSDFVKLPNGESGLKEVAVYELAGSGQHLGQASRAHGADGIAYTAIPKAHWDLWAGMNEANELLTSGTVFAKGSDPLGLERDEDEDDDEEEAEKPRRRRAARQKPDDAARRMSGAGGNDTLAGGGGNDTLPGAEGRDTATGAQGNDSLDGARGNDTVQGAGGAV